MTQLPTNKILVFDIETDSTNVDVAIQKYFGAYSFINNKRKIIKGNSPVSIQLIQEAIDAHDVIVGFNIKKYDIPVLEKYGVNFKYKIIIDLWEVLSDPKINTKTKVRTGGKGRGAYMGLKLNDWKLSTIVKALELGEYKIENFDYNILKKPIEEISPGEEKVIIEYLLQDITVTKRLFEYTNNFYYPFTEMLSEKNVKRFTYITASIASLAYKVICFKAGLEEVYGDGERFEYEGGYVKEPILEEYVGDVICFDFNSLYPSIMRGFNLFSPAPINSERKTFTGNDFFTLKGRYYSDEQGIVEKVIAELYQQRKEYKKNKDRREYLIKIVINSLYGITANPSFAQVFSRHGGEDCTSVGRQMTKYAGEYFDSKGFTTLYSDTDSCYVALNNKTKEEAISTAKEIESFLLSKMPFPHKDFGFGLDAEIKAMYFFKDGDTIKKKNYVYITSDDKLKIMGLPIIKSNANKLAVKVFNNYLKPQIISSKSIKFFDDYIKQLITYELEQDISIVVQTYKVKDLVEYSDSPNGLYAQISGKYGSGVFELVPNSKYGVGKDKKYCTVQEFKEKCSIDDVDLSTTLSNLSPFIKERETQTSLVGFGS